jgi:predicted  nucleic acid-binding Zn-ribbon protein
MASEIVRQITPEDAELARKRNELASVRAALAERELELADLRTGLRSFEGRYLRQVGALYAELDAWDARIAELEAALEGSSSARERAERARYRADRSHEATHGEASRVPDFKPPAELRSLFREVAKRVHPDFARDDGDRERRNGFMAEASEAYKQGNAEALRRILSEYRESDSSLPGEGSGAELIRILRQIATARERIAAIEQESEALRSSELAKLRTDVESVAQQGRDMLAELAESVGQQVKRARKEYEALAEEARRRGR